MNEKRRDLLSVKMIYITNYSAKLGTHSTPKIQLIWIRCCMYAKLRENQIIRYVSFTAVLTPHLSTGCPPEDVGLLGDKAAVLGAAIKESPYEPVFHTSSRVCTHVNMWACNTDVTNFYGCIFHWTKFLHVVQTDRNTNEITCTVSVKVCEECHSCETHTHTHTHTHMLYP